MLTLSTHRRRLRDLLAPLSELTLESADIEGVVLGFVDKGVARLPFMRFVFCGPAGGADPIRIGLFAGVHGDEVAGASVVYQVLAACIREPGLARGIELFCYPVCNPSGFEDGTRCNRAGVDLNREFWRHSVHEEVRLLERELLDHSFDGLVALHADHDSDGLYAFARGAVIVEEIVTPALVEAEGVLPRNTDAMIDGFDATHGVIRDCYAGVLTAPPGQQPAPFEIILETPGRAAISEQAAAGTRAVCAVLREVPRLLAVAAGI